MADTVAEPALNGELVTPEDDHSAYINEDILNKILVKKEGGPVTVQDFQVAEASKRGDNFAAILLRVSVQYEVKGKSKDLKIVAKVLPQNPVRQQFIKSAQIFEREVRFYADIAPILQSFVAEKSSDKQLLNSLLPECYYSFWDDKADILAFEDLRASGFDLAQKQKGFTLDEVRMAVSNLAKFHSISYALNQEKNIFPGEFAPILKEGMYVPEKAPMMNAFIQNAFKPVSEICKSTPGYEKCGAKIIEVMPSAFDQICQMMVKPDPLIKVLVHGDYWLNNMMFRYEDGKPVEQKIIDFQVIRFTSPAIDLTYLLFNSLTQDIRQPHLRDILKLYYDTFQESLKLLNSEPLLITLDDLEAEFWKYSFYGFFCACLILPMILAESADIPDFEKITQEDMDNFMKQPEEGKNRPSFMIPLTSDDHKIRMLGVVDDYFNFDSSINPAYRKP